MTSNGRDRHIYLQGFRIHVTALTPYQNMKGTKPSHIQSILELQNQNIILILLQCYFIEKIS